MTKEEAIAFWDCSCNVCDNPASHGFEGGGGGARACDEHYEEVKEWFRSVRERNQKRMLDKLKNN